MNDDDLRRSAQAARRRAIESTDIDAGLADVHARIAAGGSSTTGNLADHRSARRWPVWAAAAAVIAMMIGVGVIFTRPDGDSTIRIVDAPTPSDSAAPTVLFDPPATVSTSSAPTSAAVSTTDPPVTDPPVTTQLALPPTQTIVVSFADPPELVEPRPIASIPLEPNPDGNPISVAIGENEIAVNQPNSLTVTLVGYEVGAGTATSQRAVELDEGLYSTVLGPGDVLYGFGDAVTAPGRAVPEFRYVGVALSGDRRGQVVGEPPPLIASDRTDDGRSVAVLGTDLGWNLVIDRSPTNGGDFIGPSPPVATSGGRVVYSENIGDDLTPNQDFGPSAMPVVAILEPDRSGRWIRLPDDWSVVASDVWGTVLARTNGATLELALLDDLVPLG